MKKLMLSLVVIAMSVTTVFAQCPTKAGKCDAPKGQCADRLVQEMKLDDATAQWFKPLFAEYQQKLADVRAKYCKKDKKDCKNCTDAEIMKHLEDAITCQGEIADVKSAYLKKFKAKLNAKQLQVVFCPKKMKAGKHHMGHKHFGKKQGKACDMKHGKCDKSKKCDKAGAKKCDKDKKCDKSCDKKCDKSKKCDKAGAKKCDAPKCDKDKK